MSVTRNILALLKIELKTENCPLMTETPLNYKGFTRAVIYRDIKNRITSKHHDQIQTSKLSL